MELNSHLKCMEFQGQKDRHSIAFILRLAQVKHIKRYMLTVTKKSNNGTHKQCLQQFLPLHNFKALALVHLHHVFVFIRGIAYNLSYSVLNLSYPDLNTRHCLN
jgi:hypothetical protein